MKLIKLFFDCGLWNVFPILLQWLCEIAGYCLELVHAVVHVDLEHPKHAQWVTCLVILQAVEELGHFQLSRIVCRSLQHGAIHYHAEMMEADEWHDNGPQDLVMVSLCIQIAIDKMQLFTMSVAYACPYHNPTAPMEHTVHTVENRSPTRRHTRCLPTVQDS